MLPAYNLDKLTYAGNLNNLVDLQHDTDHIFKHGDIGDRELVNSLLSQFRLKAVIHFATESHVIALFTVPRLLSIRM